jgi:hypothetical protein
MPQGLKLYKKQEETGEQWIVKWKAYTNGIVRRIYK